MKKLNSIQGLRAIAVLFVVLAHLLRMEQKYSPSPVLPEFLFCGLAGVDLFFIISGFIMITVTRNSFQNPRYVLAFLYQRLTRIYPTYWFYAGLTLLIFVIHPALINQGRAGDLVSTFLLLPQKSIPLVTVSWTLPHELYFYLVFALLLLLPKRLLIPGLITWAALVLGLNLLINPKTALSALVINPLTFEFIAGAFIALAYYQFKPHWNNKVYLAIFSISLIAIVVNYLIFSQFDSNPPQGFTRIGVFGLPALIAVYALVQAEARGLVLPNWLITIGNASYSIYLSHIMVLSALSRVLFHWHVASAVNIVIAGILVIAAVFAGQLSYQWIEKPLLGSFRRRSAHAEAQATGTT